MGTHNETLSYFVDVKANIGSIKALSSQIQGTLNGLTLPKGFAAELEREFTKLNKQVANYQAAMSTMPKGPSNKKEMTSFNNSWAQIDTTIARINGLMHELGNMPGLEIVSKEAVKNMNELTKASENYQKAMAKVREGKEYQDKAKEIKSQKDSIKALEKAGLEFRANLAKTQGKREAAQSLLKSFGISEDSLEKVAAKIEEIGARKKALEKALSYQSEKSKADALKGLGVTEAQANQELGPLKEKLRLLNEYNAALTTETGDQARINVNTKQIEEAQAKLQALKSELSAIESKGSTQPFNELAKQVKQLTEIKPRDFDHVKEILANFETQNLEKGAQAVKNIEGNLHNLSTAAEGTRGKVEGINSAFSGMMSREQDLANFTHRLGSFFSLTGITQSVRRVVRDVTDAIKELDSVMTETAVVTDFTISDMWEKLPQYTKQASKLGTSVASLYEATTLYYQQGLGDQAAMDVGVETMKMARIAGMEAEEATTAMTAALRGFNMEINEISATRINDVYSELAAISASDTNQIATAMSKTASIASSANMEFETTAALLAQIIETTQEAPETAGTAMKTIIARFTEVKELFNKGQLTGEDEEGEAIEINKIDKALQSVGISLKDFLLGKQGIDDIFLDLASKWDTLDLATQRYIATTAAGSRQQSRFIAMMSNYDRTMELVTAANNSSGASQEQFNKTLDSLEAKMANLKNAWNEFVMDIVNSDLVKGGIDILTDLLNVINKITNAFGKVGSPLAKIGLVLGGFKLGRGLLMKTAPGQKMAEAGWLGRIGSGALGGYRDAKVAAAVKAGMYPEETQYSFRQMGLFGPTAKSINDSFQNILGNLQTEEAILVSKMAAEQRDFNKYQAIAEKAKVTKQQAENAQKNYDQAKTDYNVGLNKYKNENKGKVAEDFKKTQEGQELLLRKSEAQKTRDTTVKDAAKANEDYQKSLTKAEKSAKRLTKTEEDLKEKRDKIAKTQEAQHDFKLQQQYGIGQATGTGLMLAGMGLGVVGSIARNNGKEEIAEGFETASMVATTGGMALQSMTSIASTLGASLGTVAAVVAAIVVAAAALFTVYQGYTDAQNDKKLEKVQKEISQNEKNIEESKEEIKNMEEAKKSLFNLNQELKELTSGTAEWKKTLLDLNKEVFDLIEKYPSLVAEGYVTKDASGALTIKEEGWDYLIQAEKKAMLNNSNKNFALQLLAEDLKTEMTFEEAFADGSTWKEFVFGMGDFLGSDMTKWEKGVANAIVTLIPTQGAGVIPGFISGYTSSSETWGDMFLEPFLTPINLLLSNYGMENLSYEDIVDYNTVGMTEEQATKIAKIFAEEGLSFSSLGGMTKEERKRTRLRMKEIIGQELGTDDKDSINEIYDTLKEVGTSFDKFGNQVLISSEAMKQYTSLFVDNAVENSQVNDNYQDGISNLLSLTTYSNLEKILDRQKNQLKEMSEQDILKEYAKEFGRYYVGGKVYTDSTMTEAMDINKEAAIEALAIARTTSLIQEDAQSLANLVGTGNTDLFNDIFGTEGQGLNTKTISKYKKDGIIDFNALSQDLGTNLSEIADITGKSLDELQEIISDNFEMAENRINNQRKDLTHKMAKYSSGEGVGEEGRYDDSAILLRVLEEKYGDEGREMLEGVISSLEMSGDESVAANWGKFYNQIMQDGITLAEAQKLANTITDINWANPIEAADQLQEEIRRGSSASKEFATHMQETGKSFFGVGSQIRYLIESSEEFESMSEELDEIIEQNGEISAADIYDLADQYKSLGKIMDNTGASAGALASILESVRIGDLGVHQLTDAVLAAIGQIDGLASMIAGLEKDFSNFDPGIDENFASSFIAQASEVFKTNLDKGAVGNSQLDAYMDYLIGEDWDAGLNKDQRIKALESAGRFFETNSENMASAWTDMVNLYEGKSVEGLLGRRYRGGDLGFKISQNATTGEIELSDYKHLSWEEMAKNMTEVFGITEQMAKALLTDFANYSGDLALLEKQRESDAGEMTKKALEAGATIGDKKTIDQSEIDAIKKTTGIDITDQVKEQDGVVTNFYDEYGVLKTGTEAFEEYNKHAGNQKEDFVKSKTTDITQEEWLSQNGLTKEQLEWYNKNKSRDSGEDFWRKDKRFSQEAAALGLFPEDLEALRGLEDLAGGYGKKTTDFFDMAALEDQLAKSGLSEAVQEQVKLGALQGMLGDDTINEMGRAEKPYEVKVRMSDGSEKDIQVAAGQTFEEAYNQAEQAAQNEALAQAIADAFSTEQKVTVTLANDVGAAVKASLSNYTYTVTVNGVIGDISGGDAGSGGGTTGGATSVGQKPRIGPSYASGLSSAKRTHAALTGELGPELIWRRSQNQFYLAGMNGPEMTTVNPADTVFTAEETKQILNQPDGLKMPGFAKGLKGPSYASAYNSKARSGGKSTSNKDKEWENPFDKLYNLLRKIDEELRERERIERRYEKLLEDIGVSADKIISISREELAQLEKERQYQEQLISGRKDQIAAYQKENSQLLQYASVAQNERGEDILRIDWEAIDAIADKEKGSEVETYVGQLEEWFDSLTEAEDALWEIEDVIAEINERGRDEYFDLEEVIKDAVEKSYQDQIDELEKINDSINDTNAELLEGIQKTISKQRQDRENEKTEEDLADKQRRLSYLQMDTSGANAVEILKLQKEIEEGQENYTDTLIDQKISELQEQNDEAAKQREKQIDLLQAQLDHYLETGRIWQQVNELMDTGVDAVNGLIPGSELEQLLQDEAGFKGMSAIGKMEWMNETNNMIAQALAYLELGRQLEDIGVKAGSKIEFVTADGQKLTGTVDKDGVVTADDGKKYDNVYQTYDGTFRAGENITPVKAEEVEKNPKSESGSGTGTGGERTIYYASYNGTTYTSTASQAAAIAKAQAQKTKDLQVTPKGLISHYVTDDEGKKKAVTLYEVINRRPITTWDKKVAFKTGGLADFTGPAWLDGTKSRPELVLNQRDTENFIQLKDILSSILSNNLRNYTSTENNGDTTYDIDINVESIGNDYDVDKVASRVKALIVEDARYRNNNAVSLKR